MRTLFLAGCWVAFAAAALRGQTARWAVSLEVGEIRFSGTSVDTSLGGDGALRPFRPATLGLRVERGSGPLRFGLGVTYGAAAAALEAADAIVVSRGSALKLIELAPVVVWRVAGSGRGGRLLLEAGPIVDHWSWAVAEPRTRVGGAAAVRVEAPIGRAVTVLLRAGAAVTSSVFEDADLPSVFARRSSWRRAVAVGLRLGG